MRINSSARAICPVTPRRRSPILSRAALGLVLLLLLSACGGERRTKYTHSFLGTFDTVIQVVGYAQDEASFEEMAQKAQTRFEALHRLYDLYHTYEGTPNLKTINDQAGIGPVTVAQELVDLVEFSLMWQSRAGNAVNIAMGPSCPCGTTRVGREPITRNRHGFRKWQPCGRPRHGRSLTGRGEYSNPHRVSAAGGNVPGSWSRRQGLCLRDCGGGAEGGRIQRFFDFRRRQHRGGGRAA
jgi:hypothetical protein